MKKHDSHKLIPLTDEQKEFCVKHHNLVYNFLHKNRYNIEEYYSIAVIGFIKACQIYLTREDLKLKHDFALIAYVNMRSEISNHLRLENSYKRQSNVDNVSIDDSELFSNTIKDSQNIEVDFIENEFVQTVMKSLSQIQQDILICKMNGYSRQEILDKTHMSLSDFNKQMRRIKTIVTDLQTK